jgi:uncharacterized membrane protein
MNWHPMVVHFPVALVLCSAALLWGARYASNEPLAAALATVGTWNLCIGATALLGALASGLATVIGLDVGAAAHAAISIHLRWAMVSSFLLAFVAVWRGAGTAAASRPSWLFLALLTVASAALARTAYLGGQNVYRHGIGVAVSAVRPV